MVDKKNTKASGKKTGSAREQARALAKQNEVKDKRNSLLLRLGVVGAAVIAVVAITVVVLTRGEGPNYTAGSAPTVVNEAGGITLVSDTEVAERDEHLGEIDSNELPNHTSVYAEDEREIEDRPHIIFYTDSGCPACQQFEQAHHSFLQEKLSNEEITLEYRHISWQDANTQGFSSRAANASMCMVEEHPESYLDFVATISASGQNPDSDALIEHAQDQYDADIEDCVNNSTYRAMVAYNSSLATQINVPGTPYVLVDGEDWQNFDGTFPEMVEAAIGTDSDEVDDEGLEADDVEQSEEDSETD